MASFEYGFTYDEEPQTATDATAAPVEECPGMPTTSTKASPVEFDKSNESSSPARDGCPR
jgi:hypothetical protein